MAGGRLAKAAELAYAKRFPSFDPAMAESYPFYRFRPRSVKLFDERSLAGGTLVTARVTPDGLAWAKTEVWA